MCRAPAWSLLLVWAVVSFNVGLIIINLQIRRNLLEQAHALRQLMGAIKRGDVVVRVLRRKVN